MKLYPSFTKSPSEIKKTVFLVLYFSTYVTVTSTNRSFILKFLKRKSLSLNIKK